MLETPPKQWASMQAQAHPGLPPEWPAVKAAAEKAATERAVAEKTFAAKQDCFEKLKEEAAVEKVAVEKAAAVKALAEKGAAEQAEKALVAKQRGQGTEVPTLVTDEERKDRGYGAQGSPPAITIEAPAVLMNPGPGDTATTDSAVQELPRPPEDLLASLMIEAATDTHVALMSPSVGLAQNVGSDAQIVSIGAAELPRPPEATVVLIDPGPTGIADELLRSLDSTKRAKKQQSSVRKAAAKKAAAEKAAAEKAAAKKAVRRDCQAVVLKYLVALGCDQAVIAGMECEAFQILVKTTQLSHPPETLAALDVLRRCEGCEEM